MQTFLATAVNNFLFIANTKKYDSAVESLWCLDDMCITLYAIILMC